MSFHLKATMENRFSFKRGWDQLPRNKVATAKKAIKAGLNIKSDFGFYQRVSGKVIPKVPEKEVIERELIKHGIPANAIWGDEN